MMYSSCEAVQWTKLVAKQQMLCALLWKMCVPAWITTILLNQQ